MRYSRQKEEILKVVLASHTHPDAKEVYNLVRKKISNISLGTVYRNLNLLVEEGLIRKILVEDGNDRYDKTLMDHNHIICSNCGKVMDVDVLLSNNEISEIENKTGFKITNCNFNISGVCKDCMKERKN